MSPFNRALNDWHRLNAHPLKSYFKDKKQALFDLMACFRSSVCHLKGWRALTPLLPHLKGDCDWWITRPTVGSAAWPYYQNIQEYLPHSKVGVPVAVELFISPPVQIKFGEHWKESGLLVSYVFMWAASECVRQMNGEGGRTVCVLVYCMFPATRHQLMWLTAL